MMYILGYCALNLLFFLSDDDDDEEDLSLNERSDSNWTEQISFSSSGRHSEPRDNFKPNNNSSSFVRGGRGGHRNESSSSVGGKVVPMDSSHDHNHLSFLDDEDQRLSKKNEEVLKNIERARRRRAEEEQKYRVADDLNHYNDTFPSNAKRMNDHHRNNAGSHFENGGGGLLKSSSANSPFGRFDVGESDGYDSSEKVEGYEATGGGSGTPVSSSVNNPSSRKQNHQQQQSVPPRFKRHGVELHTYKRTSPPKERTSGDQGDQHNDVRSSASRDSAESQPPPHESKDFGALFRQSSSSGSSRGNRPQSGSASDLDARNDHHHHHYHQSSAVATSTAEENSKKIKETDDEIVNFSRGSGGRHSGKNNKGVPRSSANDDVSKHKGTSSSSKSSSLENSKDQKQHKRGGSESKSDRSSGQRGSGQRGKDSGGGSAKNHDRKQHGENSKSSSGGGRRGGALQRKEDDNEANVHRPSGGSGRQAVIGEETTLGTNLENNSFEPSATGTAQEGFAGWFAPRGQPSRRGRGGLSSSSSLNRASAPNKSTAAEGNAESDDVKSVPIEFSRKSQPRDAEWDDTSSDPSEEIRNKDIRRRGGERSGAQSENKSNQRREKPRKQQGKKGSNDLEDKKVVEEENESASQMNRNRHRGGGGGGNSGRNQRLDDKESRKGNNSANERGDRRGGVASERDSKQSSYERRQSKLPPRFAKQKEQNRLSGQSSAQEAWGMSSAADPSGRISESPHMTSGVAWDHSVPPASQQQFISCVQQQTANLSGGGGKPVVDFEANRALLMQRFRNENALANVAAAAESSNTQLRLDGKINIGGNATVVAGGGGGPNMEEVFNPAESRDNAVQTIIFENTNFKGKRPINSSATGTAATVGNVPSSGTNVGNEKLMFKLAAGTAGSDHHSKSGLGYGSSHNTAAKVDDDIKLDFTFETADMSSHTGEDKGNPNTSSKPNVGRPASSSAAAAAAAAAAAVVTAQPATADDLNMKIASVKKVWETLPSMSPPAAPSGDQAAIGGPFSSAPSTANDDQGFDTAAVATTRYDKEGNSSSSNMAKVRPQQQPSQQVHQQPPSQHHLQSPPSQTQGVVPSQSHQSSAQVHQLHSHHQASNQLHQATHQGLLQQASALDDRLMGRSNNANLTYNRLLGTGGLPNLQSPPSILGQQPSLYQAFQIDPNRAVTNQLYPYPPTAGMGGQSLILPPGSGSSLSAANTGTAPSAGDIFGSTSSNQFSRQFAGPPPGSNQVSSAMNNVLMSQSSLMSSAMKPSVASAGIGPIGTKGAYQQGGLGSLPGSGTSPLLIPYDGGYVQNIQRSAAAGQTAFYQALAASSQQAAAAAASSSRQNNYGITGFPGQNSLVQQQQQQQQQQLLRNHAPHPMNNHPYMKNDSNALKASTVAQQLASGLQAQRQFSATNAGPGSNGGQSQPPSIKGTATSLASMSLRNSVLGTGATVTNGATVTSAPTVQQTVTSYSPTPIQRPPGGKGTRISSVFNCN